MPTPANDNIQTDAPVRLAAILPVAFPHGGMTVSGLRKEAARGRLTIMRIAGKDFTTLQSIEEMKAKCRVPANQPDYGCDRPAKTEQPHGSFSTAGSSTALAAALLIVKGLKEPSLSTSRGSSSPRRLKKEEMRQKSA